MTTLNLFFAWYHLLQNEDLNQEKTRYTSSVGEDILRWQSK